MPKSMILTSPLSVTNTLPASDPMDDAVAMGKGEAAGNRFDNINRFLARQSLLLGGGQLAFERFAAQVLHGHEHDPAVPVAIDDADNVRMWQCLQLLGLSLPARRAIR